MLKLIRGYFVLLIFALTVMFLSQTPSIKTLYADIMASTQELEYHKPNFIVKKVVSNENFKKFQNQNSNPFIINFYFENDAAMAFARPGEIGKEVMRLVMKTTDQPLKLDYLKFKIHGMEAGYLDGLYLAENEAPPSPATIEGGYAIFDNFDLIMEPNTQRTISIKADFNETVRPGKRLRLDIESEEDVNLTVGEEPYKIREYYPIQGKYISIVRVR